MVELVIFDWAGTTVDYGCFAPVQAFIDAFNEKGLEVTLDEVREPMGALKRTHIERMLEMPNINKQFVAKYDRQPNEKDVDEMLAKFTAKLNEGLVASAKLKPFVLDAVKYLRDNNIKIGSTTGYTKAMLDVVAEEAAKEGYTPDCRVTPDDVGGTGRPSPLMVEKILKDFGITDPKNVIKIGDTVSDIEEGLNAGVYSVGVIEGSSIMGLSEEEYLALNDEQKAQEILRTRKVFEDAKADELIMNLSELPDLILRRNDMLK